MPQRYVSESREDTDPCYVRDSCPRYIIHSTYLRDVYGHVLLEASTINCAKESVFRSDPTTLQREESIGVNEFIGTPSEWNAA